MIVLGFFSDTPCLRNKEYLDTAKKILMTHSPMSIMLHKMITAFPLPDNVFPFPTCDASGKYEQIQTMVLIPYTMGAVIQTCVDPETGLKIPNAPIAYKDAYPPLDCSTTQEVEPKCK